MVILHFLVFWMVPSLFNASISQRERDYWPEVWEGFKAYDQPALNLHENNYVLLPILLK